MALLPLRPLLLHNDTQLRLHMANALEFNAVDRVLLPVAWFLSERGYYLEKQPCVPRFRQSDVVVCAYLCSNYLHSDSVR